MHGSNVYHFFQCRNRNQNLELEPIPMGRPSRNHILSMSCSHSETVRFAVMCTRMLNICLGTFSVAQESGAEWVDRVTGQKLNVSHGFRPSIHYHDGAGVRG